MSRELICPLCGHEGRLDATKECGVTTFCAKCLYCSYQTGSDYMEAKEAIAEWDKCAAYMRKREKNAGQTKGPVWTHAFPQAEGYYLIVPPTKDGVVLRYVGFVDGSWRTVSRKITEYPEGTQYFGPILLPGSKN